VYREVPDLRSLAPRQRAVLILREVLRWKASEVAELLDASVASVNSALQRARATLETTDLDALTSLLREDATWSMPPYELWLQSHDDIRRWCLGPGIGCRGSRLIPRRANGSPAFRQYKPGGREGASSPGRSRCSRSQAVGSPGSASSSIRQASSRCSGCRSCSRDSSEEHGTTWESPISTSSSRSSPHGSRSRTSRPARRAVSCSRARASTVVASGVSSELTPQTTLSAPLASRHRRTGSQSAGTSAGQIGPSIAKTTVPEAPRSRRTRAVLDRSGAANHRPPHSPLLEKTRLIGGSHRSPGRDARVPSGSGHRDNDLAANVTARNGRQTIAGVRE
jgi:hypothetical protein